MNKENKARLDAYKLKYALLKFVKSNPFSAIDFKHVSEALRKYGNTVP